MIYEMMDGFDLKVKSKIWLEKYAMRTLNWSLIWVLRKLSRHLRNVILETAIIVPFVKVSHRECVKVKLAAPFYNNKFEFPSNIVQIIATKIYFLNV